MTLLELIAIFLLSLFITLLFVFALGARGPFGKTWTFFIIIFLAIIAADLWINPIGPIVWGIAWIPLLVFGIIVALVLAIAKNPAREKNITTKAESEEDVTSRKANVSATLGALFWVILILLVIAVVLGLIIS